jgi:outer membrane lipoprotein-sorting protein
MTVNLIHKLFVMPKWITIIFACYLSLNLFAAQAQTVDDVIAKYEAAMGGRDKLATLKTVHIEGVSVMQNGNEVTSVINKVDDELLRTDVNFGMGSFSMVVTSKGGWMSNPRTAGKFEALPDDALKALQAELDLESPLVNYSAKGHTAQLVGQEAIDGKDSYKIKLTLKSGADIIYYIDANTYYIIRDQRKGMTRRVGAAQAPAGDNLQTTDYADFQKTPDGYIFPMSIKRGGMAGNMLIEKLETNKPVDQKLYKTE